MRLQSLKILQSLFVLTIMGLSVAFSTATASQYFIDTDTGLVQELGGQELGGSVFFPYQGGTGTSTPPSDGFLLIGNASGGYDYIASSSLASAGSGTVTSVAMTVPTGLSISGSPITGAGTLALTLTSGYNIPLTASTTDWTTAYDWGNHATAGYYTFSTTTLDYWFNNTSGVTGNTNIVTLGTIGTGTWNADTITVDYGGTGLTSVTDGYFLIGNSSTALEATSSIFMASNGDVTLNQSLYLGTDITEASTTGVLINGTQPINGAMITVGGGSGYHTINGATVNSIAEFHSEANNDLAGLTIDRHSNTSNYGPIITGIRSGGTHNIRTVPTNGMSLLGFYGTGWDGTDYALGARIDMLIDGTGGSNDMPASIAFFTSADNTQTPIERLRIKPDGSIGIGTSTPAYLLDIYNNGGDALRIDGNSLFSNITQGVWQGTVIGTQYGGTGQDFSGSSGLIVLTAGTASTQATSTLNIAIGDLAGTITEATLYTYLSDVSQFYEAGDTIPNTDGGTGIDSSSLTGLAYINNGTWSATSSNPLVNNCFGYTFATSTGPTLAGGGFSSGATSSLVAINPEASTTILSITGFTTTGTASFDIGDGTATTSYTFTTTPSTVTLSTGNKFSSTDKIFRDLNLSSANTQLITSGRCIYEDIY